uniref:IRS-type PTB domain-containing protein n=1 Tax=Hucho hucho TaxID=62062 RepID=A0A4W5M2S1_9TELE
MNKNLSPLHCSVPLSPPQVIRLSDCISILPALTEACPKDNMSAFCVETNDKTHVLAAERSVSTEWVEKMCEIAFGGVSGSSSIVSDSNGKTNLQMAENLIYFSREEVNEFWVSVQRTEASERCGLLGTYWLKADNDSLILKESKTKSSLLIWPYKLLRRYGRDKVGLYILHTHTHTHQLGKCGARQRDREDFNFPAI